MVNNNLERAPDNCLLVPAWREDKKKGQGLTQLRDDDLTSNGVMNRDSVVSMHENDVDLMTYRPRDAANDDDEQLPSYAEAVVRSRAGVPGWS